MYKHSPLYQAIIISIATLSIPSLAQIPTDTLPTGGKVSNGQANIFQDIIQNQMDINQTTNTAIIDWTTYNIGQNATVNYNQPTNTSSTLNRVAQGSSEIAGTLNANGQIYLLNPNGILFSKDAQVNVGSLVAATATMTDEEWDKQNKLIVNTPNGEVVNLGNITAAKGGQIVLTAEQINNLGKLTAENGQIDLQAGKDIRLNVTLDGLIKTQINTPSDKAGIRNSGEISATAGKINLLTQGDDSVIDHTGIIEAQSVANINGEIYLIAGKGDKTGTGKTIVEGTLDASSSDGSRGGFIETSAAEVSIKSKANVTTKANNGGKTGTWLIDPKDFTIASSGGDITGSAVETALANNNVTFESSAGTTDGKGNINVNDDVSYNANTLTLTASNDVNINATIAVKGTGKLALNPATTSGADTAVDTGRVNVGIDDGKFKGAVKFEKTGDGLLTIKGEDYTVINALGAEGSTTGTDLQGMQGDLGKNYALGGDIDAEPTATWEGGKGFNPIGSEDKPFTGKLNGLGNRVDGLSIDRQDKDDDPNNTNIAYKNIGFISVLDGAVDNIKMNNGSVKGNRAVGGVVAVINNGGAVNNSINANTVNVVISDGGGIAGKVNGGNIQNSHNLSEIVGEQSVGVGGIVGYLESGKIENAHNKGNITATNSGAGIAGTVYKDASITNSSNEGDIEVGKEFGGIFNHFFVPNANSISVKNSFYNVDKVKINGQTGNVTHGAIYTKQWDDWKQDQKINIDDYLQKDSNGIYQINDINDFKSLLGVSDQSGYNYQLTNNIDFSNDKGLWLPQLLGSTIDGKDYKLLNMNIKSPITVLGAIGYIDEKSIIKNLTTESGSVSGSDTVGGVVGYSSGTLTNVTNGNKVTGEIDVGGVAGIINNYNNDKENKNLKNTGLITGTNQDAGGIAGDIDASVINNAVNTADVKGNGTVGGIAGSADSTKLINTNNSGEVRGEEFVGGITGYPLGGTIIKDSFNTGNIYADLFYGGLMRSSGNSYGNYDDVVVKNSYYNLDKVKINDKTGVVTTGGIYSNQWDEYTSNNAINAENHFTKDSDGYYQVTNVKDLKNLLGVVDQENIKVRLTNDINLSNNLGLYLPQFLGEEFDGNKHTISNLVVSQPNNYLGFIGVLDGKLKNIVLQGGKVSGFNRIGGVAGAITLNGSVENVINRNTVEGDSYVGGIAGLSNGKIQKSFNNGTVSAKNVFNSWRYHGNVIGGIVGYQQSYRQNDGLSEVYNTGAVSGGNHIGGLVGLFSSADKSKVANSYNAGNVTGTGNVGGISANLQKKSNLLNTYNVGTISGKDKTVVNIIGNNEEKANGNQEFPNVTSSYYLNSNNTVNDSQGGTAKTTSEMKQKATFKDWDFDNVWEIAEGESYPLLRNTPKTTLTVSVNDLTTDTDNATLAKPSYKITGLTDGDDESDIGGSLKLGGNWRNATTAGTYSVEPSGLWSQKYAINYKNGSMTVNDVVHHTHVPAHTTREADIASRLSDPILQSKNHDGNIIDQAIFETADAILDSNPTINTLQECSEENNKKPQKDCINLQPKKSDSELAKDDSAKAKPIERRVALIIGNSDYNKVSKLYGVKNDITTMSKLLSKNGYEVQTVNNANKADMVHSLNTLGKTTNKNDSVIVYYAGHGHVHDKSALGHWIPVDGDFDNPQTWINNNDISKFLRNIPAKQIMLFSDSCFSGTLAYENTIGNESLSDNAVLKRRSVVTLASGDVEVVKDITKETGHSPFVNALYQSLQGVDLNTTGLRGEQLANEVIDYVSTNYLQVPQYGTLDSAGHMRGGDYILGKENIAP